MPQEPDDSQWWLDDNIWLDLLRPLFSEDSGQADRAAKIFHHLLVEIENGYEGIIRVTICLENALRVAFRFTEVYSACELLYQESLCDDSPPEKDSLAVLSKAVERTKAALKRSAASQPKRRRKHSRH